MKRQALVKTILESVGGKIQTEVGSLLGCPVAVGAPAISTVTKEEFFSLSLKKVVMTHLAADGDTEGKGYLFAQIKDAILLGGTLIMLPPSELEERIVKEELSEEDTDAFGEIGNIIAGVLTTTFDEYFPDKLRFVKKEVESVVPSKVKIESPSPIPDGSYCFASYSLNMDGEALSPLQFLFPCELLGLTPAAQPAATPSPQPEAPVAQQPVAAAAAPPTAAQSVEAAAPKPAGANQAAGLAEAFAPAKGSAGDGQFVEASPLTEAQRVASAPVEGDSAAESGEPAVLVLTEDPSEGGSFAEVLQSKGYQVRKLALKDDVRGVLATDRFKGVFLVMREVSEQGFAAVIRVKSAGGYPLPLIAAGPRWTRKTVLQAVKYGVCDIVMTPATPQEIGEKVDLHMRKAS